MILAAFVVGFGFGILPWVSRPSSTTQGLHTLVILAGCDAEIGPTEPLDVMGPKLAACLADQRKRLIEFETAREQMYQSVGSFAQVPTIRHARPKTRAAADPYYRNLVREGVFPRTEHGEWP